LKTPLTLHQQISFLP